MAVGGNKFNVMDYAPKVLVVEEKKFKRKKTKNNNNIEQVHTIETENSNALDYSEGGIKEPLSARSRDSNENKLLK